MSPLLNPGKIFFHHKTRENSSGIWMKQFEFYVPQHASGIEVICINICFRSRDQYDYRAITNVPVISLTTADKTRLLLNGK